MGNETKISWCDRTFSGWIGCQKASLGCDNCYAQRDFTRKPRWTNTWGPPETTERKRTSDSNWKKPGGWNNQGMWKECVLCGWRGEDKKLKNIIIAPTCPNCAGSSFIPARQRVFAYSLGDVFEQARQVTEWRKDFLHMAETTQNLDWLVLTKRIEHVTECVPNEWLNYWPKNIWIGTTVEDHSTVWRLDHLAELPAPVRFVSFEPLVGNIPYREFSKAFNWAIVGGESGPKARPMKEEWAIEIKQYCLDNDIPFHFKQWGEFEPILSDLTNKINYIRSGRKNIDPMLDGQYWHEFPDTNSQLTGRTEKLIIA